MYISFLESLLELIYPPRCIFCDNLINIGRINKICDKCMLNIPYYPLDVCPVCAREKVQNGVCRNCKSLKPDYDGCVVLWYYNETVKNAVLGLKYKNRKDYADTIAGLMCDKLASQSFINEVNIIIPIPLHIKRRWERGFNQAELLAKIISKYFKIEMDSTSLIRVKETLPQMNLTVSQRMDNMSNSMQITNNEQIQSKNILLVDDILTTGSTLRAAATVLKNAGASKVFCICASGTFNIEF